MAYLVTYIYLKKPKLSKCIVSSRCLYPSKSKNYQVIPFHQPKFSKIFLCKVLNALHPRLGSIVFGVDLEAPRKGWCLVRVTQVELPFPMAGPEEFPYASSLQGGKRPSSTYQYHSTPMWMNLRNIMLSGGHQTLKGHILYDLIDMEYPE